MSDNKHRLVIHDEAVYQHVIPYMDLGQKRSRDTAVNQRLKQYAKDLLR